MKRSARQKSREFHAVESLKSAGDAIGDIKKDCHIFAVTRGQWSMVDAILYCLSKGKKRWSATESNEFRKEQKLFKMAEGQKIWSI